MRAQKSGWIINVSSASGVKPVEGGSVYSASKFAIEGWTEGLSMEVAPFGIRCMIAEPGAFRTDFANEKTSMTFPELNIEDYRSQREKLEAHFTGFDGNQPGDPAKFAKAVMTALDDANPPPCAFFAASTPYSPSKITWKTAGPNMTPGGPYPKARISRLKGEGTMKKEKKTISRRSFLKKGTFLGASSIIAGSHLGGFMTRLALAAPSQNQASDMAPDLASVQGTDAYTNTIRVVDMLGGMGRFVSKQSKVALLINSNQSNPGAYVKPDIVLAVVRLCLDAGASQIGMFKQTGGSYWRRASHLAEFRDEIREIRHIGGNHRKVAVKGRALREAEVSAALLDWGVFINIPIAKNHTAVHFTGTMKNMMGLTSSSTNRFFHFGGGSSGWYDDPEFLSQCIADVNLVRRPDLSIFDGMEMLTTNGPSGPGKLTRPQKVFASTDAVAADVYGANLLGLRGREILATRMAHEHGLGNLDLSAVRIEEAVL